MQNATISIFEDIKRTNQYQQEFWSARQLAKALEYTDYRNFEKAINRAKESCKNAGQSVQNHFVEANEMIELGKTASRQIQDIALSRYACYLIMQNADPSKEVVALGQSYFAIQTRRQELQSQIVEDQKRVTLRGEITIHNKHLAQTATQAGVKNYGIFANYGYMGLYGGLKSQEIAKKKKLKSSQKILDYMGSEELAANLFRATQADAKLKREDIHGEVKANQAHFEVGKKVRQTIQELGGTMPENLQASESIGRAKTRLNKLEKVEKLGK